jgi:hypothetical protein
VRHQVVKTIKKLNSALNFFPEVKGRFIGMIYMAPGEVRPADTHGLFSILAR